MLGEKLLALGCRLVTAHGRNCQHPEACPEGRLEPGRKIRSLPAVLLQFPPLTKLVKEKLFKGPRSIFSGAIKIRRTWS